MHEDDIPGYMYDDLKDFMKRNPEIVNAIKVGFTYVNHYSLLADFTKKWIKEELENEENNNNYAIFRSKTT